MRARVRVRRRSLGWLAGWLLLWPARVPRIRDCRQTNLRLPVVHRSLARKAYRVWTGGVRKERGRERKGLLCVTQRGPGEPRASSWWRGGEDSKIMGRDERRRLGAAAQPPLRVLDEARSQRQQFLGTDKRHGSGSTVTSCYLGVGLSSGGYCTVLHIYITDSSRGRGRVVKLTAGLPARWPKPICQFDRVEQQHSCAVRRDEITASSSLSRTRNLLGSFRNSGVQQKPSRIRALQIALVGRNGTGVMPDCP